MYFDVINKHKLSNLQKQKSFSIYLFSVLFEKQIEINMVLVIKEKYFVPLREGCYGISLHMANAGKLKLTSLKFTLLKRNPLLIVKRIIQA
jgi:hypothetical protein